MNKYIIRASKLKEILSNPQNYFEEDKDISNLPQVVKGKNREIISYDLFNDFIEENKLDLDINYQKQAEGKKIFSQITLQGHPDILSKDYIVDIKNSKQADDKLIEEYKYQLLTYAYIFNIKNVYLFVDNNTATNTDLRKCRLIKVDIEDINMEEILTSLIEKLNITSTKPVEDDADYDVMSEYYSLIQQKKDIEEKIKTLEINLEIIANKNINVISNEFELRTTFKRDIKYKPIKKIALPWNGAYKQSWELVKKEAELTQGE